MSHLVIFYNSMAFQMERIGKETMLLLMFADLFQNLSITFEYAETYSHTIRLQVNTLIYKKVLRLSLQGLSQTSTGNLVNLVANDTMFYEMTLSAIGLTVGSFIYGLQKLTLLFLTLSSMCLFFPGVLLFLTTIARYISIICKGFNH